MSKMLEILILTLVLSMTATVHADQYEASFSDVQQMLRQSVKNDEAGLSAIRQQLESVPKPARQNVKEARTLNQQGLEALKQQNYQAAVTAFQQAQQADSSDIEVTGNLGYANLKLGQFKRAEHQLVYAISLAPTRVSSWFNLGQVYGALNDVERATGAFANAYRFSQNRPKTEEFLRQALTAPENNETTRAALKRTLQLFDLPLERSVTPSPPVTAAGS
ncbi:MAG: tetratricopeptide repeat protein, partial [Candidatus Competibacteraceae bacterium]